MYILRIEIVEILFILFAHWVADFVLQTSEMGTQKSKSNVWLLRHIIMYSTTILFFLCFIMSPFQALLFTGITFIVHFITDYLTSRWTSKLYKKEKYYGFPAFFSVIGLDQFLHNLQLILTYMYVITL